MKWVGRVLLVLLIASALFVAKQNDFQTETAYAQTGSTHNLTLNLNDIEVRVVKNDNSSSTTAGSAIIDSKTSGVYFNKVKVTNNSNQDAYFRIMAQLYYGTIPGPCAIVGGSLCTPPNQYRVVGAGQTLVLPDNTFFLPASMFSFLSGQYPFQTLALQGINKADLMFILTEAGYGSANVTKTQILKWSAVRIKLQNGAGTPVSNKRIGLFKEGESNTQPPPDQWRYGNTNAAGQVAMALLDPITILPAPPLTYTARYVSGTNPQDYTDLPPPVVVTGPDFQDLTYTICDGGTGGQGFLVERAHAQECLPDLVPIVDGISIEVTDGQNIKHNIPMSQFPAGIGSDIKKVELKNIKIKNIGSAPNTSGFTVRVNPYIEYSNLPWEQPLHDAVFDGSTLVNTTINPGQTSTTSIILSDIRWNMASLYDQWSITKLAKANKSSDYLYIFVDSEKNIHEQNENNNTFKIDNAFNWAVIKAIVSSWINNSGLIHPIPITVAFRNVNDPEGRYTKYATLGKDSLVAFFAPTESLYSGWKSYVISVYVGGTLAGKSVIEVVTDYRIYPVTLNISSGILIRFSGKQEQEFSSDGRNHYFPASSGTFTLKSFGTKKQYNYSLKNFSKFIPLGTIPDGEYQVITTNTQYKESRGEYREDPINTKYPEPTRGQSGAYPMMIDIGPRDKNEIYDIANLLSKYCQDLPNPTSLRLCIYDDPETKDKILNDTFPLVKAQVNRLKSFQYGAGGLKKIIFSPDTTHEAAAFYNGDNRDEIVINMSGASPLEPAIAVHETFHLLDDFYRPGYDSIASSDSNFQRSVRSQFSTTTGKWLWDKIIRPSNYDHSGTGYSSYELIINNGASYKYKYKEVLAEEMSTTCLFQDQLLNKLNGVESIWRQTRTSPPPGNLISQRDNALNRIKGRVKDGNGNYVTIPEIASWFQQCGR